MKTLFKVWSFLDGLYFSCSRLEYVNKKTKNIFRVKLLTYRGKSIALSNGTYIRANDVLLKIHLHNCLLMSEIADIKNDTKRAIYVYQRVKSSMPGLADFIRNHPKTEKIKGIIGVTILSRGVSRLGFEVKDIPNPYYRAMRQSYMKPIFLLCHAGKNVSRKPENLVPKFLIMPKDRIFSQYLQQV
ncbi:YkoP family protein [Aneurinibacillus danicus]|jgi:hypothetical protein|uniref:YkoP-like domain-containing protein n=1 Tax=Aneurinibacillus danicus TaxID=267746 RepID=A0A511V7L8_9BACL|nr:hypothetical protein [Aneurinibacillus danicus]GEN33683.1 hypothetical protein ADA01nite_11430 [Aneurinibacillus danicus]